MVTINRVADLDALISTAALKFIDVVAAAQSPGGGVHGDGVARVVLTGGGAGIGLLKELQRLDRAADEQGEDFPALRIDWERIHVFFGDERNVPVTDADSNEGQAREALLDHVGIPNRHIHGFDLGAISMSSAAQAYEEELREFALRALISTCSAWVEKATSTRCSLTPMLSGSRKILWLLSMTALSHLLSA